MLIRYNGLVISNQDPVMLNDFNEIVAQIECSLSNLRLLAVETDFGKLEQRQEFHVNVEQLKHFYERAEYVATKNKDISA